MRALLALAFFGAIDIGSARSQSNDDPAIPKLHTERKIEGWTVHIDNRLLDGDDKKLGEHALRILANRLYDIKHVVPADKVKLLQKVPIWLDKSHGKLRPAQYHPNKAWLKANGFTEYLAKCVHIPVAANFSSV